MGHPATFIILAIIALASGAGVLLSRNAVHSAMYLVLNFVTIAVFYILLEAPFISMVQITVYAGAIVVLFLFVIMLLGAERLGGAGLGRGWQFYGALVLAIVMLAGLLRVITPEANPAPLPSLDASPEAIGMLLFESYVFPFEITSILLLVAMMSLVVWQTQKKRKNK